MKQKSFWILAFSVGMIPLAIAQQYVYPAKGQSPQQQQSDESACYSWAVQQTGFDPAKQQPAAKPATTATGTTPGAGARGAVRGAVVGEVVGGDAGTGAAVGAAAARGQSRRQNAATQQQQQGASQQQVSAFSKLALLVLRGAATRSSNKACPPKRACLVKWRVIEGREMHKPHLLPLLVIFAALFTSGCQTSPKFSKRKV